MHFLSFGASWLARLRQTYDRGGAGKVLLWAGLLGLLAYLLWLPVFSQRDAVLADERERLQARAHELDVKLGAVAYQVDSQRHAAQTLLQYADLQHRPPLSAYLANMPGGNSFGLAQVPPELLPLRIGNVYGRGRLETLSQQQRHEVDVALALFPLHRATLQATSDLAWVYYASLSEIYAVSPWGTDPLQAARNNSHSHPKLLEHALKQNAFLLGTPKRNPERRSYWTGMYADPGGHGVMVTHGAPVYQGDAFRGVVAVDLRLSFLSHYLGAGNAAPDSRWLLVENSASLQPGQLIAATDFKAPQGELPGPWRRYLQDELQIMHLPPSLTPQGWDEADGYYIQSVPLTTVPWTMVYVMPRTQLLGRMLQHFAPALGVLGLLLLLLAAQSLRLRRAKFLLHQHETTDPLTGISNRRDFFAKGQREQARHCRHNLAYSLVLGDIDHFKAVNERYGHKAGDWVLKTVAEGLVHHLREEDLFARLDGEQFACLLVESDSEHAQEVARRLCRQVANTAFVLPDGERMQLTASFGVATCDGADEPIELLVQRAELALYRAKTMGRNGVEFEAAQPLLPFDALPLAVRAESS